MKKNIIENKIFLNKWLENKKIFKLTKVQLNKISREFSEHSVIKIIKYLEIVKDEDFLYFEMPYYCFFEDNFLLEINILISAGAKIYKQEEDNLIEIILNEDHHGIFKAIINNKEINFEIIDKEVFFKSSDYFKFGSGTISTKKKRYGAQSYFPYQ